MLSRRRAEGEPDYLREVKNEFMAQWDGIRYNLKLCSCLSGPILCCHGLTTSISYAREA